MYDNRTVANSALFDITSPSGSGLGDIFQDSNTGWTVISNSATQITLERTYRSQTMRFRLDRTGATASTFKIYFGTSGTSFVTSRTVTLSTAATYSGNVKIVSSIDASSARLVFQTSASGLFRNTFVYIGAIDALDPNDVNSYGVWVSDAPEQYGENFLAEGFPRNTRESMLFRAIGTASTDATSTSLAPFRFAPIDSWDGEIYRYNATGSSTNAIVPSASFTGPSLADIFNEAKYMGNRMTRIGCYRETTGVYSAGLRGTLKGVWKAYPEWLTDSVGNVIPKTETDDILTATVKFDSHGSANFANQTAWTVVCLSNQPKLRESLWIGPHVVAFPNN